MDIIPTSEDTQRPARWPYVVSAAAAAIAVSGIAALADVELWTAPLVRMTAVASLITGYMHYVRDGYHAMGMARWFLVRSSRVVLQQPIDLMDG